MTRFRKFLIPFPFCIGFCKVFSLVKAKIHILLEFCNAFLGKFCSRYENSGIRTSIVFRPSRDNRINSLMLMRPQLVDLILQLLHRL